MTNIPVRKPHTQNGRFQNDPHEKPHTNVIIRTGLMWAHSIINRNFKKNDNLPQYDHDHTVLYAPATPSLWTEQPTVTWIGHASFLIQVGGVNILTDPIFGKPMPLFTRNTPPGIMADALPPIDVVLISHNHWDHMHGPSLQQLLPGLRKNNGQILVPHGDENWFHKRSFEQATPFTWGQQKTIEINVAGRGLSQDTAHITFTFLPARHWSRRGLFDRNKSLWGSWMIQLGNDPIAENNQTIYFAGDSAYADHFKEIRSHFPSIDVALMPIAPCEPDHVMREMHMNAEEAVHAYLDLNAQRFIPMHWHTFNFGSDRIMIPLHRLQKKWELVQLPQEQLLVPKVGQGYTV